MELPSKLLERRVFITRPKIEEHMLIVMVKSTHKEHLSQPLQSNNKQYKISVTFLSGFSVLLVFTMLQFQIISSISRKQLVTKMVLFKLLYLQELMNSNR